MPLIFKDNELLFVDGVLAMSEDCCCGGEALICSQWNNSSVRAAITMHYTFDGLTIGTNNCGNCGTIPLTGSLPPDLVGWSDSASLLCGAYRWGIGVRFTCVGETLSLLGTIQVINTSFPTTDVWQIQYTLTLPASDFSEGDEVTLAFSAYNVGTNPMACTPSGYSTSTMQLRWEMP